MPRTFEVKLVFDDDGFKRGRLELVLAEDFLDAFRKAEAKWGGTKSAHGTFLFCEYATGVLNGFEGR